MRLATASERRSQQPPDQTSAYRCGRSRLRRLGQPYQPSPRPEFYNGIGRERKPDPGYDQVRFAPMPAVLSARRGSEERTYVKGRLSDAPDDLEVVQATAEPALLTLSG